MIVMILENVTTGLRGELTRWMIEPKAGVFVGDLSARVRDLLWDKCIRRKGEGGVIQIWSSNTEQNFQIRMEGNTDRELIQMEGIQLIRVPGQKPISKRLKEVK